MRVFVCEPLAKHHDRQFYARYGFQEILQSPNRMFLSMKTLEAVAIESAQRESLWPHRKLADRVSEEIV